MVKLIRITSETCSACVVMKEVMRRVMPEFPEIEIEDYDLHLDEDEVNEYNPGRKVPFIQVGNMTKTGSCTMDDLREFLKTAIQSLNGENQ